MSFWEDLPLEPADPADLDEEDELFRERADEEYERMKEEIRID